MPARAPADLDPADLDPAAVGAGLVARDRGLLWHPYAPLDGPAPYAVTGADGVRLRLVGADGARHEAIDAMSSWWCAVHGYRHPVLDAAVRDQVARFSHVMFGGLTHEPAVRLAERLVAIAPAGLEHVFLADSGSISVEVALKLAVQYQAASGRHGRRRFLAPRGGYHGDTVGALSVCDPVDGLHALFTGLVPEQVFVPRPPAAVLVDGRREDGDPDRIARWTRTLERTVARHADQLAAIVTEPVLQGAGGMYAYSPACLAAMRRVADEHDLLLIADEIATGFGRTGRRFAVEWARVTPDVMCVGKALTGGYLTLAATLCTMRIAETISGGQAGALMHGPTFMANALACAVSVASVELLLSQDWRGRVAEISAGLAAGLEPARALPGVADVRVRGAIGVIETHRPVDLTAATPVALDNGVWLRPFRNLIYAMPPFICPPNEIAQITSAMVAVAQALG